MEYLHVNYEPPLPTWIPAIIARLNSSSSSTLRERAKVWSESSLREAGFALATKLVILAMVIRRVDNQLSRLGEQFCDRSLLDENIRRVAGYILADKMLPYEILLDIDSFLFESRSTYEIVGNFLRQLFDKILGRRIDEAELKQFLEFRNIDTRWISELRDDRILFFHKTAPWIALGVISREPFRFELVVLKKDVRNLDTSEDCISFERLRAIYRGFESSLHALPQWILEQIQEFEEKEASKQGL